MQVLEATAVASDLDITTKIATALAELGDTADAVANTLLARDIKGYCKNPVRCPISHVILAVPGVETCEVLDAHAIVWTAHREFEVTLPEPVATFVTWFDDGMFLALVYRKGGDPR